MTALAGVELESLVSEPDALTTRPPPTCFCKCKALTHPGFRALYILQNNIFYLWYLAKYQIKASWCGAKKFFFFKNRYAVFLQFCDNKLS